MNCQYNSSSLDSHELYQQKEQNHSEDRGHILSSQRINLHFSEELYERAASFLDDMDVYIVSPEVSRKPLFLIQSCSREVSRTGTIELSRERNSHKATEPPVVFELKTVKESPLMLRRKLALTSSMRVLGSF